MPSWQQRKANHQCGDQLAVNIGIKILKYILGRICTGVDVRLSFNTDLCIAKARKTIGSYQDQGIDKSKILIKLSAPCKISRYPYDADTDLAAISVRKIYNYYKQQGYKIIIMGASFRKIE